jgi:hypothetical protein
MINNPSTQGNQKITKRSHLSNHPFRVSSWKSVSIVILLFIPLFVFFSSLSIISIESETNGINQIDDKAEIITPLSSIRTINCTVRLYNLNVSQAFHGDHILLFGNVTKFDGVSLMIAAQNQPMYPVINNVRITTITNNSNSAGLFWLTIPILPSYDIYSPLKIEANTSTIFLDTNCTNQLYLDIKATARLIQNDVGQQPAIVYTSIPYTGYTNYHISGTVQLDDGSDYSGPSLSLNFYMGTHIVPDNTINTDGNGNFNYYLCALSGYSTYKIEFVGNSELGSTSEEYVFELLPDITVSFLDTPASVYQNTSVILRGQLISSSDPTYRLAFSTVELRLFGIETNVSTDNNGRFSIVVDIPFVTAGNYAFDVELVVYDGSDVYSSFTSNSYGGTMQIAVLVPNPFDPNSPNALPYNIIILIVVAVGAVIGIFYFQKRSLISREKKWKLAQLRDIESRLHNVGVLIASGRPKEAIAYLFKIYTDLTSTIYSIEKNPAQTTRDLAIILVKQHGQNPESIYPFIRKIESVVYGGVPANQATYEDIMQLFNKLYSDLMGNTLKQELALLKVA